MGTGPLAGVKVVELAGIGPGPHACMILADLGADVVRVDRPGGGPLGGGPHDILTRGRPSVALDLKRPGGGGDRARAWSRAPTCWSRGCARARRSGSDSDPGACHARNERLVFARMTGWGRERPAGARSAGHDMNYISVAGALFGLGQDRARPHFPSNLLRRLRWRVDVPRDRRARGAARGARLCGRGQVVDAAIVDGTAHQNAMRCLPRHRPPRRPAGVRLLDGGMPYYNVYETSDGRHLSVAPLEGRFYEEFLDLLGLAGEVPDRNDFAALGDLRTAIARGSRSGRRPSGSRSSRAPTPAWPGSSRSPRRSSTRRTRPARCTSTATASCSPHRPRASRAPLRRSPPGLRPQATRPRGPCSVGDR